jgi:hypothetical protein
MAIENALWRGPRIHGGLLKLGITVSERTVSRFLRIVERPPSQTWRTFLKNHVGELVSIDFFTVPTATLRVLFVFVVFEHERRIVLHFGVTEHPTAAWAGQQIIEAFADRDAPRFFDSRSGRNLWSRVPASREIVKYQRGNDCTAKSLAEWIREADHRFDPAGMAGSHNRVESKASEKDFEKLFCLLSPLTDTSRFGERFSGLPSNHD